MTLTFVSSTSIPDSSHVWEMVSSVVSVSPSLMSMVERSG